MGARASAARGAGADTGDAGGAGGGTVRDLPDAGAATAARTGTEGHALWVSTFMTPHVHH